jgi:NADPH:quinone reductase-like Zn-dependent oxidoreductase
MRAVAVTALGGPEVLHVVDLPDPVPGPGEVLVRTRFVCVQPADIGARVGMIPGGPVPPPFLPGWDFVGEVVALSGSDSAYAVGDLVVGMVPWLRTRGTPGAYAEFIAAGEDWIVPLPSGVNPAEAATVPLNGMTAYQALDLLDLAEGEPLFVTGASGGLGGFAAELAARQGNPVIALANDGDEDWVRALGATTVIPRTAGPAAAGRVRAVFDAVPMGVPAAEVVADGGVLITTRPTEPVDPARGIRQQIVLIDPVHETLRAAIDDFAAGRLHTRVAAEIPFADAPEAHRAAEAHGRRGKIILVP